MDNNQKRVLDRMLDKCASGYQRVLKRMSELITDIQEGADGLDKKLTAGNWTLRCVQKAIPSGSTKNKQIDKYVPVDEKLKNKLKNILGIDYFAVEYTTKKPTDLEVALSNPFNASMMMDSANCTMMAFDENNKPLLQYGTSQCFIERTKSKTEFDLVEGTFPTAAKVEQAFNVNDFVQSAKSKLTSIPEYKEIQNTSCVDDIIKGIYEKLQKEVTDNVKYSDFVVQQYVSESEQYVKEINKCFAGLICKCVVEMNRDQANAGEKVKLAFDKSKFEQSFSSVEAVKTAYKALIDTIKTGIQQTSH